MAEIRLPPKRRGDRVPEVIFRPAEPSDAQSLSALVRRALHAETLPGWTEAAVARLHDENSERSLRESVGTFAFAEFCIARGSVVGFIASKVPRMISLLVVDPACQRLGIGSSLVERKLAHLFAAAPEISVLEVNATEHSIPFYRRQGFYPISEFIDFQGCRFARLGYWRGNPLRESPAEEA